MSRIWPAELIRELLTAAEKHGTAKATLDSVEDANKFRFSVYTFRKANSVGEDLIITVEGNEVIARRRPEVSVEISVPFGTIEEGI
jgi:hypothetical protein